MFIVAGCESIALMPRAPIDDRNEGMRRERDTDRGRDNTTEIPRNRGPSDEITGTVQKVDQNRREIELRTTQGRMMTIKYDAATIVYDRDREMPVDSLRYGDLILIKVVKNNRGEQYADLIRLAS
jgi:hypothetical protein